MPDLRYSYVGKNYNVERDNFTRFGTRELQFYSVEFLVNFDFNAFDNGDNPDGTEGYYDDQEWVNPRNSIWHIVTQAIQQVAEVYTSGDWDYDNDGSDHYGYITYAVARDTVVDDQLGDLPSNSTAISDVIYNALEQAGYGPSYVDVWQSWILGNNIEKESGGSALTPEARARLSARNAETRAERAAARAANGLPALRKTKP